MKKILTLISCLLFSAIYTNAQIFWTENFGTSSSASVIASAYTGPNGTWGISTTGSEGVLPNEWYVSCQEAGQLAGTCGSDCGTSFGLGPTLHLASAIGDLGASYIAGSAFYVTDRRANSPTINCTGRYGITLAFYYIEAGELTDDDASVWYSPDNGVTWSLLVNTPKTAPICPGITPQGMWTHYTYSLPASADNNSNVKIGFRWVNDGDGTATDPSFAVDSVSLSGSLSTATPVPSYTVTPGLTACTGNCLFFDNTTTGAIDSLRWSWTGGLMAATDTMTMCYMAAGTFPITLTVYKSGTPYTTSRTITVNPTPAPITGSHTGCVTIPTPLSCTTPGGTWSSSNPSIASVGATTGIVTGAAAGSVNISYSIMGCNAIYTFTVYPLPCTLGSPVTSADINGVEIFPNPATNELFINMADGAYAAYEITNEVGQSLVHGAISMWQTRVDVSTLPAGLYYIRLRGEHGGTVRKFVKAE